MKNGILDKLSLKEIKRLKAFLLDLAQQIRLKTINEPKDEFYLNRDLVENEGLILDLLSKNGCIKSSDELIDKYKFNFNLDSLSLLLDKVNKKLSLTPKSNFGYREDAVRYKVLFNEFDGRIFIVDTRNEKRRFVHKLSLDSGNEKVFFHLYKNPNKEISLSSLKEVYKNSNVTTLYKLSDRLKFRKDLKVFFKVSSSGNFILFRNPILQKHLLESNLGNTSLI